MFRSNGSKAFAVIGAHRASSGLRLVGFALFATVAASWPVSASAATSISGRVTGAGAPISGCTVTLWAASPGAPKQLAQATTGDDGGFSLSGEAGSDTSLYLLAKGGT